MRQLTGNDLDDFLLGVLVYACGGGGSRKLGEAWIAETKKCLPQAGLTLAAPEEIGPKDGVVTILVMTDASTAKTIDGSLGVQAFRAIREHLRGKMDIRYVIAVEMGAGLAPVPLYLAAKLAGEGVIAVDADGAGRVIPSLDASLLSALPVAPMIAINAGKTVHYTGNYTAAQVEWISDNLPIPPSDKQARTMGAPPLQNVGLAIWPAKGAALSGACASHTVSEAIAMGAAIRACSGTPQAVPAVIAARLNGEVIFTGRFVESTATPGSGLFTPGTVTLTDGTATMTVANNWQNVLAWRSDSPVPVAMVPDLIVFVNLETGEPFTTNPMDLPRPGTPVAVVAAPPNSRLAGSPKALQGFTDERKMVGYYGPYTGFRDLHQLRGGTAPAQ